jgi:shikimate dehydrogenase
MAPSTSKDAILTLDGVVAGYGKMTILNGVSATIRRGAITTVIGPNGAGKSTLFKTVFGLLGVRTGRVTFDGADTTSFEPRRMLDAGVSYVPQGRNLFAELSVRHNLELGGVALSDTSRLAGRMDEMMTRFPMLREKANAQASTLSGGQQKLLEVARGLLLEPKLMLIDEPSIGLSPLMVQEVFSILKDLRSAGVSILMIEQNARQALAISDYGLVLEQGQTRISSDIGDIAMTARMLVGLIGTNIQKSLAPALHEDAFAAAGVAGHYHLMDVSTLQGRRLEDLLASARIAGFAGVNITHPFKEAVIPLLDAVSTEATEIGAVNTVVFDKSGRTTGHNTDCSGFRQAFIETFGADAVRGKPVLLLGAGGAGRAVAVALMALGASTVRIYDQDQARATSLCADLIMRFGADRCELLTDPETAAAEVAGIVNATPVGMTGYPGLPLPVRLIQKHHLVADVIYTPIDTKFVLAAQKKGCRTMNGGGMCVHQAVDAFRHFTGLVPDVARMKRTFETACAARDAASATGGPK